MNAHLTSYQKWYARNTLANLWHMARGAKDLQCGIARKHTFQITMQRAGKIKRQSARSLDKPTPIKSIVQPSLVYLLKKVCLRVENDFFWRKIYSYGVCRRAKTNNQWCEVDQFFPSSQRGRWGRKRIKSCINKKRPGLQ